MADDPTDLIVLSANFQYILLGCRKNFILPNHDVPAPYMFF
jgi:hypothetical protein